MTCGQALLGTMEALRECTAAQLGACGRPVCQFPLYYADHPAPAAGCDCECEDGGQGVGWVRLVQMTGSPTTSVAVCAGGAYTAVFEVGVHRCAPTMLTDDAPLTNDQLESWVPGMIADADALRRAPMCCDWFDTHDLHWTLQQVAPLGPLGGCVGTAALIQVDLTDCGCPDEEVAMR